MYYCEKVKTRKAWERGYSARWTEQGRHYKQCRLCTVLCVKSQELNSKVEGTHRLSWALKWVGCWHSWGGPTTATISHFVSYAVWSHLTSFQFLHCQYWQSGKLTNKPTFTITVGSESVIPPQVLVPPQTDPIAADMCDRWGTGD